MKRQALRILKYVFLFLIALSVIIMLFPIDLFDMKQAQRIAKWKSVYEQLEYSFSMVNLFEGCIVPKEIQKKEITLEYITKRIIPYLNLESEKYISPNYKYRKMNGSRVKKDSDYYYEKFLKRKDGVYLGIKENTVPDNSALYTMFIDINGNEKPNIIGKDIFFINIYQDSINALGKDKEHSEIKTDCSPIGEGFYCSEHYLLGGRF